MCAYGGGLTLYYLLFLLLYTKKQPTNEYRGITIIEQEEKMNVRFYQFARFSQMVPQLNKQVKLKENGFTNSGLTFIT